MHRCRIVLGCLAFAVAAAWAEERHITANALFEGRAMLTIDGRTQMLRAGQRSSEGVRLVSATAREAVIEIDGRTRTLRLSREIGTNYAVPERREIAVPRDPRGQYLVGGSINGFATTFMVDTGANVVAMSGDEARRMGIDYRRTGELSGVVTAAGPAEAWHLTLDRVEFGGILVRNVPASVIEGAHPAPGLLGMSWLSRVALREEEGVLYLRER